MHLREMGWGGTGWIHLSQDRDQRSALVNTVMDLRVPEDIGKFLSSFKIGGFSSRVQLYEVNWLRMHCYTRAGSITFIFHPSIYSF
jgi:hypothetical protein